MFLIFELHLLHIFTLTPYWLIKDDVQIVASVYFYEFFSLHQASLMLLLLLSFYSHLHLLLFLALLWIDWLPWMLVGHVPQNWSKVLSKFSQFTNHHVGLEVTGKKINHGVVLGLEISINCFFYGDARVTTWMKRAWRN